MRGVDFMIVDGGPASLDGIPESNFHVEVCIMVCK